MVGFGDVWIKVYMVGVCGSDVYYYVYGGIGLFCVDVLMVFGYEVFGMVVEIGVDVMYLCVGDCVCMEFGVLCFDLFVMLCGFYNFDFDVCFWVMLLIYGCLMLFVVYLVVFMYWLFDNVLFVEGVIVELLLIGL